MPNVLIGMTAMALGLALSIVFALVAALMVGAGLLAAPVMAAWALIPRRRSRSGSTTR